MADIEGSPDGDLVRRAQSGDKAAQNKLSTEIASHCFQVLTTLNPRLSLQDKEDLAQDILAKWVLSLFFVKEPLRSWKAFNGTITRNHYFTWRQSWQRRNMVTGSAFDGEGGNFVDSLADVLATSDPARLVEKGELVERIGKVVTGLSAADRVLLERLFGESKADGAVQTLATESGVAKGTIYTWKFRLLKELRQKMVVALPEYFTDGKQESGRKSDDP